MSYFKHKWSILTLSYRRLKRYLFQHRVQFLWPVFRKIKWKCNRMIEEAGALLIESMKSPSKIKAVLKWLKGKCRERRISSQLKDNTCQRTNKDNLSVYDFMLEIKSNFWKLRFETEENQYWEFNWLPYKSCCRTAEGRVWCTHLKQEVSFHLFSISLRVWILSRVFQLRAVEISFIFSEKKVPLCLPSPKLKCTHLYLCSL